MKKILLYLLFSVVFCEVYGQVPPTSTTFSQTPIMTSANSSEWFVLLSGNPKVWKRIQFNTVRDYMTANVRTVNNATGLLGLTELVKGDVAIKSTRDSMWFRTASSWIGVSLGGSGGASTLSAVLALGNNAGGLRIVNLGLPVAGGDATNKTYVDAGDQRTLDTAYARMTRYVRDNGGATTDFNGNRVITRNGSFAGLNVGTTTTIQAFLEELLFPSTPPTMGLSGVGGNRELMATGAALSETLNWSVTRASNGGAISSTVVNGGAVTANPAAGATASGSVSVSVVRNTNATFSATTTDAFGKTGNASVTVTWLPKRYWGMSAVGLSLALSSELSNSQSKSNFLIALTGTASNIIYAYPASLPALTSLIVNGLESIEAFTVSTGNFTNASGYTQTYRVYTSVNTFSGSGNITINNAN